MEAVFTLDENEQPKDIKRIEREAAPLIERAKAFEIKDDATYEEAGGFVVQIKEKIQQVKEFFAPMKDQAFKAHRTICDKESQVIGLYEEAIKIVNRPLIEYWKRKERVCREEEARLLGQMKKEEEEARLREAEELEKAGEHEAAEQVISQETVVAPPILPRATPKVKGLAMEDFYFGEIVNKDALIKAVLDKKVPQAAIIWDMGFINRQANAMGPNLNWPGVVVRQGTRVRGTGRR